MSKRWLSPVLSVAVLLALSGVSSAGPGGHSGSHSGHSGGYGGHSGHSGYGGYNHGYHSGGYGHNYYGGGYNHGYYGSGIGVYLGSPVYGYGSPYYGSSYFYDPSYNYVQPSYSYVQPSTVTPAYYYSPQDRDRSVMPAADVAFAANFEIRVPEGAEIWFEGEKTSQTGSVRVFASPAVQSGRSFTYDVRARWTSADGKVVDQTRQVQFRAGQSIGVDFLAR